MHHRWPAGSGCCRRTGARLLSGQPRMKTLLNVSNLAAGYGAIQIVNDVSLDVAAGSIVALIGGNGAGKTTLVRAIAGSLPIRSGNVVFDGIDISGLPANRRVEQG